MNHHVHFSHETVNWKTPETLYVKLNAEFHFDWDPCPLDGSDDALLPLFVSWRNRPALLGKVKPSWQKAYLSRPPQGDLMKPASIGAPVVVADLPASDRGGLT
jgi:hypothetical protein